MRFIGFSTHAPTPVIVSAIESDAFDYVNLHYHFIGSYTASGTGTTTSGNLEVRRWKHACARGLLTGSQVDRL